MRRLFALLLLPALVGCRAGSLPRPLGADARRELPSPGVGSAPRFIDVTAAAGLRWRHSNGARGRKQFPETMGGGGGFVDVDGDGWLDVVLIDSAPPPGRSTVALWRNEPGPHGRQFVDRTTGSGLRGRFYGMGLAVGDADGDGDPDLYVTALGPNRLFRNDGHGRFTDATARAGVGDPRYSTSAAFLDHDRDGDLDLFVCNYARWDPETELPCFAGDRVRIYCPPTRYPGARSTLYRNEGGGRFTDVTTAAGIRNPGGKSLGVVVCDLNEDGRPDLYVANDLEPNCAFIQGADGRFSDRAPELGIAVSPAGRARAGMGVDARRLGPEGPTLLVGNYQTEGAALFSPVPGGFAERTAEAGLLKPTLDSLTFGLGLLDLNLDTHADVVMLNGHVEPDIARYQPAQRYRQRPQLFLGAPGGAFMDVSDRAGDPFRRAYAGRGLAWGDFDNDGDLDLLAVENNGPAHLWRNETTGAHWLTVVCEGGRAVPSGYGATVEIRADGRTQVQTVRSGSSYLVANDPRLSFGLGGADRVEELIVRWPDGHVDRQTDLGVDRLVPVRRQPVSAQGR